RHAWQRDATRELATGGTREALTAYERAGAVISVATHQAAQEALLARWTQDSAAGPRESRLMLAYTRDDVHALNALARAVRRDRSELGREETIETERGPRAFAVNDRLYFLRNERSLGVKNGTLGTIEAVEEGVLQVRLDGTDDRVVVDTHFYRDLDHGYAATVHKSQGTTVDRTYVLATSHYDRHTAYVALSRHRESATVFYSAEDFVPPWRACETLTAAEARIRWFEVLSRARPKELAHDYLDRGSELTERTREPESSPSIPARIRHAHLTMRDLDALQQQAAERWSEQQRHRELTRDAGADLQHSPNTGEELASERRPSIPRHTHHAAHRGLDDDFEL
ncbi:MAG: hypothetical protein ACREUG_11140, partial [Steroidobacteraceae bacterium]